MVIFIMNCISYSQLTYKFSAHYTYTYPNWSISIGWLMACSSIIMVPIVAIYKIIKMLIVGPIDWPGLIRPKLLPHQMRPGDDPRDIDPEATMENTFLPADLLARYDGSLENYKGPEGSPSVAYSVNGSRLPDYDEAVDMEAVKLQPV